VNGQVLESARSGTGGRYIASSRPGGDRAGPRNATISVRTVVGGTRPRSRRGAFGVVTASGTGRGVRLACGFRHSDGVCSTSFGGPRPRRPRAGRQPVRPPLRVWRSLLKDVDTSIKDLAALPARRSARTSQSRRSGWARPFSRNFPGVRNPERSHLDPHDSLHNRFGRAASALLFFSTGLYFLPNRATSRFAPATANVWLVTVPKAGNLSWHVRYRAYQGSG